MVLESLSYTLLVVILFSNGTRDYVPLGDPMPHKTCQTEAAEKRTGWLLDGDRSFAKDIHYFCIPQGVTIP